MSQDPSTIPNFDEWQSTRTKETAGKRPALLWGAQRKGHKHQGEDFGGATDTPVGPDADGEVVFAGPNGDMGNTVKVRHSDGVVTSYGHLNRITVEVGGKVAKGEQVGLLGRTGNAKGPHVHYEVHTSDNLPIDPATSLYRRPVIGRATRNLGLNPPQQPQGGLSIPTFAEFVKRGKVTAPALDTPVFKAPQMTLKAPVTQPVPTAVKAPVSGQLVPTVATPRFDNEVQEQKFQQWYGDYAKQNKLDPSPDDPRHQFDYRAAFVHGVTPDQTTGHLPSQFKLAGHPNRFVDGVDTITGQPTDKRAMEDAAGVTEEMRTPEYWGKKLVRIREAQIDAAYNASLKAPAPPTQPKEAKRVSPTPKPEVVIVQQAIRNPEKLQRDLLWHFGPGAIADFEALDPRGKQKMILYATQQAARDEIKKEQGQTLIEDAGYQAKMRERIPGLKKLTPPAPTKPTTSEASKSKIDASVDEWRERQLQNQPPATTAAHQFDQSPQTALGLSPQVSYAPGYNPQTGKVEVAPISGGMAIGEMRRAEDKIARDAAMAVGELRRIDDKAVQFQRIVNEELSRTNTRIPLNIRMLRRGVPEEIVGRAMIANDPSIADQPSVLDTSEVKAQREVAETVRTRIETKGTILGKVAQQWPAFLGHVQDLGAKTVRMVNRSARAVGGAHGFAYIEPPEPGLMNDVAGYLEQRAQINRAIGDYNPPNLNLPEKITREIIGQGYNVARIVATVEATGLSLPAVMVGESVILNSDKDAKTQAAEAAKAYAFGWALTKLPVFAQKGLGKVPGAVGQVVTRHPEATARTIGAAAFGPLAGYEVSREGGDTSDVIAATAGGAIVGGGLAGGGIKRIGEHVKRAPDVVIASERSPEWLRQAAAKTTGKTPVVIQSETAEGETPRFASVYVNPKTGEHVSREVSPQEASTLLGRNRPGRIVPEREFIQVFGRPAETEAPTPAPQRLQIEDGTREPAKPAEAPKPNEAAPPIEPPAPAPQEAGRITPKRIIKHSDPNIDGGEVIGTAPDGRLQVRNNSGGISLVQNPRTQGNQNATIVKTAEAASEEAATVEADPFAARREEIDSQIQAMRDVQAPTVEENKRYFELIDARRKLEAEVHFSKGGQYIPKAERAELFSPEWQKLSEARQDAEAFSLFADNHPEIRPGKDASLPTAPSSPGAAGTPLTGALQQPIVRDLGETVKLPEGEIPDFKPLSEEKGESDLATEPGKVETVSRDTEDTQPIREPRAPKSPTLSGAETEVSVPDEATGYKARYTVREAEDVIPSHNPQSFQPNPDYYHTNDRRYESEPQYQMQVIDRSKPGTFDPRRIANNSPTVDVGPPVIDSDGNVLGGNSRAMILHRIYAADDQSMSNAYRQELLNQAQVYGLDPQQIAAMKRPILVRELSDEGLPQADTQRAITDLNRPSTTPLTQSERANAAASQISPEAADYITQQLENAGDDATVASVMDRNGVAIINKLIADGIFQPGERNTLIQNDKPTAEAKTRIEQMLVSGVYRDSKQMDNTPVAVRRNIERIVVPLNKIAGTEWDIADTVKGAIDAVTESKANGIDLDKLAIQGSLARQPYTTNEIALAKVLLLGPRKTAEKFRGYGNDYSMAASGGGLFGAPTVAESQKIHFGLEPETRTVAPPKPKELPATGETAGDLIARASELGRAAFAAGIKAAPALDPAMAELIKTRPKGVEVVALLDAWNKAWHSANLAAPVQSAALSEELELPSASTLETGGQKAQTTADEQLPETPSGGTGPASPDALGRTGTSPLETVPAEPLRGIDRERGSGSSSVAGAGQGEGDVRPIDERAGLGSVPSRGASEGSLPVPDAGERAGDEPVRTKPVDHTIAAADADARKPDRTPTEIIDGAKGRAAENAEDSPTAHAVTLTGDYFIEDVEAFSSGSLKQKYQRNIDALVTLRQIQSEGRLRATPEEQATLARFVGWGQFPALMNEINDAGKEWATERQALKSLLSEDEWRSAKASIKNAHYTAPQIVQAVWDAVRVLGFTRGRTLEPSMGPGIFFALMPRSMRKFSQIAGVELDKGTGQIAQLLYPNADVQIKGFEEYNVSDDFFDLVISNFPFGDYQVADPRYPKRLRAQIHDYFFVKALDKVRPGGLVVGITSTGTLDKQNTAVREHLGEKADLVAAIRLPGNTFLKEAGTAVVTDLIILRKRIPGEEETPALKAIKANKWLNAVDMPEPSGKQNMVVNEYYKTHPEMIIGKLDRSGSMWRADAQNVTRMVDFEDHLQRAIASIPAKVYSVPKLEKFEPQVIPAPEELKQGSYTIKDGKLFQKTGEHLHEKAPSKEAFVRIEAMIGVRDALNNLLYVEIEVPSEAAGARKELSRIYDAFVKKHGFINETANAKIFADDPDRYRLFALEKWDKKTKKATKTDIFTKPTRTRYERPTSAKGIVDAVGIALNETGSVDLDRIASLLDMAPEDVGMALVAQGVAFNDPKGGWTPRETYLSGPVRQKLLEAEEAARLDPQYQPNVEALKAIQPQDVPHSKISARMGAPWIPESDIQQFMADMMSAPVTAFSVKHDKTTGRWYVGYRGGFNLSGSVKDKEELGTPQRSFPEIIQAAIDDRPIKVTIKSGDVTFVDRKASAAANKKVKEIRKKFANWIWQEDERRGRLHRQYNERYNDTIPLKVDGSHQTFPGMNELISLRDNQKNVVWRGVTQGRVMMAHEVGTGKTFSMIAMGMERRRLKLSRKPCIACLNTNVAQVTEAAHLLYPGARILAAHEGMTADTRQKTVTQIATGDWDLVILTHDNLDDIPLSKETQMRFIKKEVDDLKAAVLTAKREAGSDKAGNRAVKDLEKKLENRKAMLQSIIDKPKDDAITFEETGMDFLMVDESHKFKSLPVYTARGSVKGIPTSRSDRATNMFMRSQWMLERNNNQGLVFATGTPISNTLVELFNVQRFLQTPELEARGIDKFDAWAATFAESQTKLEYTPTGDWLPITRFSLFTNLADLSHLASQMMDVAFADEIEGLVRPKRRDHVVTVPMSVDQKSYLQSIRARAAALAHAGRPKKGADNWLVLTNDARKAAIDMRLIDRSYPDDPNSKLNRMINEVLAQNKENPSLTQLIFSDMGINPTERGISLYDDIIKKLVKGGIPREQVIDFSKFSPGNKNDQRAKAEGMERLSNGKAKVGLGGTEKLGTGVNVQELLYNLHHLDAPYRPSDIEQRDGRGWRDQNKNKEIRIGRYTTEGSFDTQMWQTLDTKNKFIRSFMRGDVTARSMEEEDTEELSYAQIMATTSGNPLLIKKMELEAEAAELESDFQVHQDQTFRLKDQIARSKRENAYAEVRIKNLTLDAERFNEEADKDWSVTIKGKTYTRDLAEEETAQAHDIALAEKNKEAKEEVDKAKQSIAFYKGEAKEKGLLGKAQTDYARAQVPKAFEVVDAFKKLVESDVEMMPQTKIAEATVAFREGISKQIDAIKANWSLMNTQRQEGVSQPFGRFRGFDLVIVGEKEDDLGPALVGPSGEHHTFSWASARPGQVFADMEGRISAFERQADSQKRYIEERNKEIKDLTPLADKPFAEIVELERLRKAVDLVTQELTASGASLPLPEGFSNLSTRYKADGKLMAEESPIDVHEEEGEWTGGDIAGEPIFRDRDLVLLGNPPGEVLERGGSNWDLVLDAHVPDVRLVPVAIEDITESVWFDNGMTMSLGYMDIIMANHPKARFALTNSRRFPNTIVVTDGGKTVGFMDVGKPKSIDDDLQPAVRMARDRAAVEVKGEAKPALGEPEESLGDAAAGGVGTGGGGQPPRPPKEPPDPLTSDEDPEEAHAMAMSATRMPLSDVALPGFEKSRVSAAKVIKRYEAILDALGHPTPIRTGHIAQRTALGIYKPRVEVIRLKTANNIPTGAHEVGHGIQKAIYGATKARALTVPANVKRELVALGKALYGTRKPAGGYRSEGFAEFVRHYLTTDEAATVAPNTLRWFETQLLPGNPILAQELRDARKATDAYRMQGAENRAAANMKGAPSLRERIDRAIAATKKVPDFMLDEFSPLFRLTKLAEESQGPLDIMDNPAKVASVLRGSATTKVQYMVEDGMLDFASNKVGPPLQDAAAMVKGEKERFSIYMVARRAQERWSQGKNPGMTLEDANALVVQLETPKFEMAAQRVYDWNNGILEYVKQAAPTFGPLIEKIQRTSHNYVPLARVFDPSEVKPSKTVEMAGGNPLKRMKGSGRAIHDIFPQMIANAEKMIAAAHKRRVLDTIVRLSDREGLGHLIEEIPKSKVPFNITTQEAIERLEKMGADIDLTNADLDEVMTFFTPAQFPKGQEPIVPVMRDGVMRWYYVNPDLYGTLMGMDLYRLPKLWDLLVGVPTRVFRAGTTAYRASFALFTNPTRDVQTFIMQTRSHKNPAELTAYWTRSMAAAFSPLRLVGRRDEVLDTFYRLGAQLGQPLGLDIALTHKTAKRLFRGKVINTVTSPLEVIQEFLSLPESASRVAEIRALASEVGWTPGTPMSEAQAFELALAAKQVTVDFSAAGRLAKIINQCSPFFNAGIQGGRSFARALRDNPRRSVLRGLMLMTIPTLLLWWRNKDKEWYTDMPDRTKYLYWHIEAGEQVIEIPRAFEWGNAFATVPEVFFDTWYRKDPEGVKGAVGHIYETTVPDVLPVVARNAKEQWQNRIEFFDRPIVPRGELDLPPGEQRGPYTSKVAVWLGKKFPDTVSPRRVDALIRGFGGGVAPDILNVVGLGSQRGNREREMSDIPVFGRAFQQGGKGGFGSKALESFYDQLSLVKARASSTDRPETDDQREFRLILEDANGALKVLRTVQAEIPSIAGRQQVTHVMRMIAKTAIDKSLTPEQRVEKMDALMKEQPAITEKVAAEVEKKRLAKAEERAERPGTRATFDLPGSNRTGVPPKPAGPPSPP